MVKLGLEPGGAPTLSHVSKDIPSSLSHRGHPWLGSPQIASPGHPSHWSLSTGCHAGTWKPSQSPGSSAGTCSGTPWCHWLHTLACAPGGRDLKWAGKAGLETRDHNSGSSTSPRPRPSWSGWPPARGTQISLYLILLWSPLSEGQRHKIGFWASLDGFKWPTNSSMLP